MIEIESYRCCVIDNKGVGDSTAYKQLKRLYGDSFAAQLTYDYVVTQGSDELREAVNIALGGHPPKNMMKRSEVN